MATINFLPVCSCCGHVLYGEEINYEEISDFDIREINHMKIATHRKGYVTPSFCPRCKAILVSIEIPTKLPFNTQPRDFYRMED